MDSSDRTCSFARLKFTARIFIQITLRKLSCSFRNNVINVTQDGFSLQNVTKLAGPKFCGALHNLCLYYSLETKFNDFYSLLYLKKLEYFIILL